EKPGKSACAWMFRLLRKSSRPPAAIAVPVNTNRANKAKSIFFMTELSYVVGWLNLSQRGKNFTLIIADLPLTRPFPFKGKDWMGMGQFGAGLPPSPPLPSP